MRTASEIRIEYMLKTGGLCSSNIEAAINAARREALEGVHAIIATMDWDVMSNTIDAKILQEKINTLLKELK